MSLRKRPPKPPGWSPLAPARFGHEAFQTYRGGTRLPILAAQRYDDAMASKSRIIEVDAATADTLEARAAERGVSVARLVSELAGVESSGAPVDTDQIRELDRRWAAVAAGGALVANEDVVRWLSTWGTPAFKPWHEQ